jgi:hypothetical protein
LVIIIIIIIIITIIIIPRGMEESQENRDPEELAGRP